MSRFHKIEGEQVILRTNGTFKQVDVYEYHGELFAGSASSWIRLMDRGSTSKPNTFWADLEVKHVVGQHGRLKQV